MVVEGEIFGSRRIQVCQRRLKPWVHHAAVIGDNVQNHVHSACAHRMAQGFQSVVAAQMWVNIFIIDNVITMIAEGSEDRIEIDRIHAKIG